MASVSVIVAVLNQVDDIGACLDSVISQRPVQPDLVVIDGGSADGTVEEIRARSEAISYWVSESDRGIYDAFNKAVREVKTDWVLFLGSDDTLCGPHALERIYPILDEAFPAHRVVYAPVNLVDQNGRLLRRYDFPWERLERRFQAGMNVAHQGVFQHRSIFDRAEPFDPSFQVAGDYELLYREFLKRPPRFAPGNPIANNRVGGNSSRRSNAIRAALDFRRARLMNGGPGTTLLWSDLFARAVIKWSLARVGLLPDR